MLFGWIGSGIYIQQWDTSTAVGVEKTMKSTETFFLLCQW